jgi:hypothetical protein
MQKIDHAEGVIWLSEKIKNLKFDTF